MPGPCSHPLNGTMGKSRYVRLNKKRGSEPANGYPPNLKARIANMPTNTPSGYRFTRPGSYKK